MDTKLYWTMCGPKNGWGLEYVLQSLLMSLGSIINLLFEGFICLVKKKENLHFDKVIRRSCKLLKMMRQKAIASIRSCQSSRANHVYNILGEVGANLKVSIMKPLKSPKLKFLEIVSKAIWGALLYFTRSPC